MIYAVIAGIVVGYSGTSLGVSAVILLGLIVLKAVTEITFKKTLIGTESPYQTYLETLRFARSIPPWVSYLVQSFFFGGILGGIAFTIVRSL